MEFTTEQNSMIQTKIVPGNFGPLKGADANARITGPCGDTMEFWILIKNNCIHIATFTTDGCRHSILCGSAAASLATGLSLHIAKDIDPKQILAVAENIPVQSHHCALLAANTLKAAINHYQSKQNNPPKCDSCHKKACQDQPQTDRINRNQPPPLTPHPLKINHKILVLSGKGGVGKSMVAVNLATDLAMKGKKVGLLDIDIHGPSIPTMLGLINQPVQSTQDSITPIRVGNLRVMSIGFLLNNPDDAVIWRGPIKIKIIDQFLQNVHWGKLDYLIIDCPPGTGDEPLSICQRLETPQGALLVTTPQEVAAADVRKTVNFCRQLHIPIIGIVENMSEFFCPKCAEIIHIFDTGAGNRLASTFEIPFLGSIPIDPEITKASDQGKPFVQHSPHSAATLAFTQRITTPVLSLTKNNFSSKKTPNN
jgi:ATP-binding protein involved in chromosome partitioning